MPPRGACRFLGGIIIIEHARVCARTCTPSSARSARKPRAEVASPRSFRARVVSSTCACTTQAARTQQCWRRERCRTRCAHGRHSGRSSVRPVRRVRLRLAHGARALALEIGRELEQLAAEGQSQSQQPGLHGEGRAHMHTSAGCPCPCPCPCPYAPHAHAPAHARHVPGGRAGAAPQASAGSPRRPAIRGWGRLPPPAATRLRARTREPPRTARRCN